MGPPPLRWCGLCRAGACPCRGPMGTSAPTGGADHVGRDDPARQNPAPAGSSDATKKCTTVGQGLPPAAPSFRGPEGAVGTRLVPGDPDCRVGPAALLAMTKNDPARRRRGAPMCAPRTGGQTRRSAPTDNDGRIYGAPAEAQRRQPRVRWGESEQRNEGAFPVRGKRTIWSLRRRRGGPMWPLAGAHCAPGGSTCLVRHGLPDPRCLFGTMPENGGKWKRK